MRAALGTRESVRKALSRETHRFMLEDAPSPTAVARYAKLTLGLKTLMGMMAEEPQTGAGESDLLRFLARHHPEVKVAYLEDYRGRLRAELRAVPTGAQRKSA